MYKGLDQENKSFTLIHWWNKLNDEDKWKAKRRELAEQDKRNKNKKQKVHTQSTPRQQTVAQEMTMHLCKHKQKVHLYKKMHKRGRPVRRRQKKL